MLGAHFARSTYRLLANIHNKPLKISVISLQYCSYIRQRMSGLPTKMAKLTNSIGTHDGTFHCDEVLACYMLKQLPEYRDADIVRTRDATLLDKCDIVVDVGGTFSHETKRYDHHQRSFTDSYHSLVPGKRWTTKLSSAGLVYVHYGQQIVQAIMRETALGISSEQVEEVFDRVYDDFIEEIDAVDNGVAQTDEAPRYRVSTTLSKRVGYLNPRWNEENIDISERFYVAMAMAGAEFRNRIKYYQHGWLPARDLVKKAVDNRFDVDASGEIVVFSQGGCPWKDHLLEVEPQKGSIKYVLYEDHSHRWRIQCVPERADSFTNRLSLPAEWCGVRDEELSKLSGISGCIFVHANGFIGGNQTYEGVLKMATESLRLAKKIGDK